MGDNVKINLLQNWAIEEREQLEEFQEGLTFKENKMYISAQINMLTQIEDKIIKLQNK